MTRKTKRRRKKNADLTVHGVDARAAVAAISDIARLGQDPEYGSQERSLTDIAVALDQAMRGKPVFTEEESREALEEYAKTALRRVYYRSVSATAEDIVDDAMEQFASADEANEWFYERVHEQADGSHWVIYMRQNLDVLQASDNWDAISEAASEGIVGELNAGDFSNILTQAAFFAYRADLQEAVESRSEEVTWPEDEDEDEEDEEDNPRRRRPPLKARLLR